MLLNALVLYILEAYDGYKILKYKIYIEFPTIILSFVFLVDLIANFAVNGFSWVYENRRVLYFEIVISVAFWICFIIDMFIFTDRTIESRFTRMNAVNSLRIFRAFELVYELTDFKFIF